MQSRRFLLPVLILCAPIVLSAQMTPDLQKKVGDAVRQHRADIAADLICEAAKQDPKLQGTCTSNQQQVEIQRQKFEQKYNDGVKAVQEGRLEDAKTLFRTIYFGDYHDRAQDWLNNKIPATEQQAKNNAQAAENAKKQEADDLQHLVDGQTAFDGGDFGTAKGQLSKIQGARKVDAVAILNKIAQYEQAMSDAQQAEAKKNYDLAKQKFSLAASIKANGPGNPGSKAQAMDGLLAANRQQSQPPRQTEQARQQQPSKVDVGKLLKDAARAKASGDTLTARRIYAQVMAAEPGNPEAEAALLDLNKKAGSEADIALTDGIDAFYRGQFDDAELNLKLYQLSKGTKVGIAKFYMGASKLTRYYLDPKPDQSLYEDGLQQFRDAKKVAGFTPPDPKYISPKIFKIYERATP
jgi:hypothetical protein